MMDWITTPQVLERLKLSRQTLARLEAQSVSAGIRVPRVDVSPGRRAHWRWDADKILVWLEELATWRSRSEGKVGECAGEISAAKSGASKFGRGKQQKRSGAESRTQGTDAMTIDLRERIRQRLSRHGSS